MTTMPLAAHTFSPEILRAYDIRGTYLKNLGEQDAYILGRCLAVIVKRDGASNKFCIGMDGRLSSPHLHYGLLGGLLDSGCEIIDIDVVATPALYFAAVTEKDISFGIMITGSHNPPGDNGFKIIYQQQPFYGDQIQNLAQIAAQGNFVDGYRSQVGLRNIKTQYIESLSKNALSSKYSGNLKIAWDSGNGATGRLVEMLVEVIPAQQHITLYTEIDGTFPNHHPDPTIAKNVEELSAAVLSNNCDIGFAFDGDGDRIGVIDDKGRLISGDKIMLILAEDLLTRHPGATIVADVKTSDTIFSRIAELGGRAVMSKTGHSYVKVAMKQEGAMLGGEVSGHLFFAEDYYGFDDALFAACKIINIISNSLVPLSQMVDNLPSIYSTNEIRLEIDEDKKFGFIDQLTRYLDTANISYNGLDGVRVQDKKLGWWLVRASNTQNALIVKIEGNNLENLKILCKNVLNIFDDLGFNTTTIREIIYE